ncbi:hypothetical protein [Vallitalea guaymasensis]|uniref:hypothetical protein n=1 Tax=Vallitalea guaymasensis TaxID=1185412 RepID=UPI002356B09A|nr:hypothetical protein [Vallitalea guaymasensis]
MANKKKTSKNKIDEKTTEQETVTKDKPEEDNNEVEVTIKEDKATKKKTVAKDKPDIENDEVEVIKEEGNTIIVKAKKGLSIGQFELLSQMLKSENKKTEYEIVLMPYSVDTVDIK